MTLNKLKNVLNKKVISNSLLTYYGYLQKKLIDKCVFMVCSNATLPESIFS